LETRTFIRESSGVSKNSTSYKAEHRHADGRRRVAADDFSGLRAGREPLGNAIKAAFVSAANKLFKDKNAIIADFREIESVILDTASLEAVHKELVSDENARVALDQSDYQTRFQLGEEFIHQLAPSFHVRNLR
jgi:hypothetical protein